MLSHTSGHRNRNLCSNLDLDCNQSRMIELRVSQLIQSTLSTLVFLSARCSSRFVTYLFFCRSYYSFVRFPSPTLFTGSLRVTMKPTRWHYFKRPRSFTKRVSLPAPLNSTNQRSN